MNDLIDIWERPSAEQTYMIAGWHQWADAGSISSGLPQYLVDHSNARKIGEIKPDEFYLFQIPGTHHFLRPEIKLEDGYRTALKHGKNEIYFAGDDEKGLVIFLGQEPHLNAERYADAFFDVVEALEVKRVAAVGGVYGAMPYDKDREVSCAYSLKVLKDELAEYAVRFSNYEGGATIGSFLLDKAEQRGVEFFVYYAFVPAYDFSQLSSLTQGVRIDNDFRAWYELMLRLNHMFNLGIDLTELEQKSDELLLAMDSKLEELEKKIPELNVKAYMQQLADDFTERSFMPLGDVWELELGDLFNDIED